jgi:uncharacterized membrane protein YdjX (TVP38/TMEM64 family)
VSWAGMSIGCVAGYYFGKTVGLDIAQRIVGKPGWEAASSGIARIGFWMILVARPVPALADATVLVAGSAHMPFGSFALASVTANLVVSLVYAYAGSRGPESGNFIAAFGAALLLPALALAGARLVRALVR